MNYPTTASLEDKTILPLPPENAAEDMAIYVRFMRHLRHVPNNRLDIKILSAIQFTADMLDCSDAHVAKVLVDMGLRAPRMAFPAEFLKFADASLLRSGWDVGGPSPALHDLKSHWNAIGEDRFSFVRQDFTFADYRTMV